jgi:hypothetical protein
MLPDVPPIPAALRQDPAVFGLWTQARLFVRFQKSFFD